SRQLISTDEYAARAHGSGFTSKPPPKERKTKNDSAVQGSRNDRATRLARWFQGRRRSRQKSRLLFAQRRVWQTAHRSIRILRLHADRILSSALRPTRRSPRSVACGGSQNSELRCLLGR